MYKKKEKGGKKTHLSRKTPTQPRLFLFGTITLFFLESVPDSSSAKKHKMNGCDPPDYFFFILESVPESFSANKHRRNGCGPPKVRGK